MSTAVLDRPPVPILDVPPAETAPRPRVSEAMRQGATYHPQGRGALYNAVRGTTCALGAVAIGLLGPEWTVAIPRLFDQNTLQAVVWEHTGIDLNWVVKGPPSVGGRGTLASMIMWLNDKHGWSREAIADYLESIGF